MKVTLGQFGDLRVQPSIRAERQALKLFAEYVRQMGAVVAQIEIDEDSSTIELQLITGRPGAIEALAKKRFEDQELQVIEPGRDLLKA